jgi:hypothetical protein
MSYELMMFGTAKQTEEVEVAKETEEVEVTKETGEVEVAKETEEVVEIHMIGNPASGVKLQRTKEELLEMEIDAKRKEVIQRREETATAKAYLAECERAEAKAGHELEGLWEEEDKPIKERHAAEMEELMAQHAKDLVRLGEIKARLAELEGKTN